MIWDMPKHFFFNSSVILTGRGLRTTGPNWEVNIPCPWGNQIKISNKDLAKTTTGLSLFLTQISGLGHWNVAGLRGWGSIWHIACPGKRAEKVSYIPGALHVCHAPQSHLPAPWPWVPLGKCFTSRLTENLSFSDASGNSKMGTGKRKEGGNVNDTSTISSFYRFALCQVVYPPLFS